MGAVLPALAATTVMVNTLSIIPQVGQLAEVRGRRFVATDVRRSQYSQGGGASGGGQHLVTLSSVGDGSLGEELQVLWEAEIGARCFEREQLPEPGPAGASFDDPHRLDAFLDAVRWGVVSGAERRNFHAPFRSGIEIEDYQLNPLVRAVQMPRVNLLIADAVGLGKTVEAGLIVQELISRNRVRTVLIVCRASLQIHWREEMWDKSGLEFQIVDSAPVKHLRRTRGVHTNPSSHFPRLITSSSYLRRDRNLRLFQDLLPADGQPTYPRRFDLLICDEAHNLAPSGKGARFHETKQSLRYTLSEPARRAVLDRLLPLNHERHADEVAQGLLDAGRAKPAGKVGSGRAGKVRRSLPREGWTCAARTRPPGRRRSSRRARPALPAPPTFHRKKR